MWCPVVTQLAKLVKITPISPWFMVDIANQFRETKPTCKGGNDPLPAGAVERFVEEAQHHCVGVSVYYSNPRKKIESVHDHCLVLVQDASFPLFLFYIILLPPEYCHQKSLGFFPYNPWCWDIYLHLDHFGGKHWYIFLPVS